MGCIVSGAMSDLNSKVVLACGLLATTAYTAQSIGKVSTTSATALIALMSTMIIYTTFFEVRD